MSDTFLRLHQTGLLILPNVWDAGSARLVESLGAPALATTSAGVAWVRGYRDGDHLPVAAVLETVEEIARVVSAPVSTDLEGGYSDDPARVAALAKQVRDAGASGVNLEDGAGSAERLADKISAVKAAAPELFVNARTDVWLRGVGEPEGRVEEALRRAALYHAAGADGLFCPYLAQPQEISRVVADCGLPLNLMAKPDTPSVAELRRLGVRRLSAGSAISEAVLGLVRRLATGFLNDGRIEPMTDGALAYGEANALFL